MKNYLNFYPEAKTIPIEYKWGKLSIGSLKIRLDSKQAQEIINLIKERNSDILKSIRIINNLKKELENFTAGDIIVWAEKRHIRWGEGL